MTQVSIPERTSAPPCDTIQGMEAPSEVVDYDDEWPALFESIRGRIAPALEDLGALVEHVGSTAVPGLAAKPIVDIDVVVRDATDMNASSQRLEELGYVAQGDLGVSGREAFAPPSSGPYHHLYVVVEGNDAHRNHVDLRDYLRRYPNEAKRYADRKRAVAHLLVTDRATYTDAKSALIEDFLVRARGSQ
jgi:GrpB-like predicted nucleotidyltransferase (UPF0157 family)